MNSVLSLTLKRVARDLQVDEKLVESVYKSYWKFIRNHISGIPMKELSEEELSSYDTNFNIPYIGKLYMDDTKIKNYKKQLNYYRNVKLKKDKADRL